MTRAAAFLNRRVLAAALILALLVAASVSVAIMLLGGPGSYTVTARFVQAPGLYAHNRVDILGVPTGTVRSVTPKQGYVEVVLSIPDDVRLPAGVKAVLVNPNPVSDRTIELAPAYTGGATLAHGSTIPLSRTAVPLELDQVYSSVDNLAKALGPGGANSGGALSAALHALAQLADGNGQSVHQAIDTIAAALPALTKHPDQLKDLINGIDRLTSTLASHNDTINALYGNLSRATSELAAERATLASAVSNLQSGLAEVAGFLRTNQGRIGSTVKNLTTTVSAVMQEQDYLIKTFDTAALGFQNFNNAVDPDVPCVDKSGTCPALFGRLDLTKDAAEIVKRYCGNSIVYSMLPIMAYSAGLEKGDPLDTLCGAEIGLLQNQPGAPQAPQSPDLDLGHFLPAARGTR
jgi:virulence factor Mce-like protein